MNSLRFTSDSEVKITKVDLLASVESGCLEHSYGMNRSDGAESWSKRLEFNCVLDQ